MNAKVFGVVRHAVYVYAVGFVGLLGATQWDSLNVSTPHALEIAVGGAALGALYKTAATVAPSLLAKAVAAGASAAATAGVQDSEAK